MKLLVIEDDIPIGKCLKEFITLAGHECELYNNPVEGVAASLDGRFDVILTDIIMPEMNGLEVLEKIREHHPEAYVILMTGFANVDNAIEAVNRGAYAFFRKPLDLKEVMQTLKKIEKHIERKDVIQSKDSELMKLCMEYKDLENSMKKEVPENSEDER
jgi:two-component system response regulator HydG